MKQKYLLTAMLLITILVISGCMHEKQEIKNQEQETTTDMGQQMPQEMNQVSEQMSYVDVDVMEAKKMIDEKPDLIVIDVSPNYAKGHLPRAINYYVGDGSLDKAIPSLDKNATYLVYCHVDSASISGAQKLIDAGFKNVYRLEGNYKAWIDAGYPIEK